MQTRVSNLFLFLKLCVVITVLGALQVREQGGQWQCCQWDHYGYWEPKGKPCLIVGSTHLRQADGFSGHSAPPGRRCVLFLALPIIPVVTYYHLARSQAHRIFFLEPASVGRGQSDSDVKSQACQERS